MPMLIKTASYNVLEAARIRLRNIFSNGVPVVLTFSGGKDSLVMGHLVYTMLKQGEIDPKLLSVQFIDEEAIFPCVEQIVMDWRERFMALGIPFGWYCVQVRHFNCLNTLEADESFICWDAEKKSVWVRPMPPFAISSHPLLKEREETYQTFLDRLNMGAITLVGTRFRESVQRQAYLSKMKNDITADGRAFPIYDWRDNDVWLYLKENDIEIPDAYLYLWQVGTRKRMLRISQFFSPDTAGALLRMNEFYPDLMDRVTKREPNAYLVALYWDSEMFRRSTAKRRELEGKEPPKNYKQLLIDLLKDIPRNFPTPAAQAVARRYSITLITKGRVMTEKAYKKMYEALIAGDPKLRTLRATIQDIFAQYTKEAQRERGIERPSTTFKIPTVRRSRPTQSK